MSLYGWLIRITDRLPEYLPLAYLARRYADRCQGFNTIDPRLNGEHALARKILPRCSVVFDIGANVGEWTQQALAVNPKLAVHCFEPVEANLTTLRGFAAGKNVIVNAVAVSDHEGASQINLYESAGWHSLADRTLPGSVKTQPVQLTTIDAYRQRAGVAKIDFAKIDVEGLELAVLKGMQQTLSAGAVDAIQFEYGGTFIDSNTRLGDVYALLAGHGYDLYKLHSNGPRRMAKFDFDMENFQYQNWVAVRRGSTLLD